MKNQPAPDPMNRMTTAGKPRPIEDVIRDHTMFALDWHNWVVKCAADSLGLSPPALYVLLKKYGVDIRAARRESQK